MWAADLALIYQCSNNITASAVYHHGNVGVATNIFLSCASLHLPLEPREVTSTPGAGATSMSGFPAGVSGLSFLKALRSCHTLQH